MLWTPLAELGRNLGIYTTVNQGEGWDDRDSLSTLVTLVYIRVKINVRYVTIQDRTTGINHAIRELRANSHSMSVCGRIHERWFCRAQVSHTQFLLFV